MLCSGLDNWHCLPGAGEGKQICSVSRNAVDRNVSTVKCDRMVNRMDTVHRRGDFNVDMDFSANPVVNIDVQGIPGRDVQVADCRGLCRKTNRIKEELNKSSLLLSFCVVV